MTIYIWSWSSLDQAILYISLLNFMIFVGIIIPQPFVVKLYTMQTFYF